MHSIDINQQGDQSVLVAGTKYQPLIARVIGKLTILSLEGKVEEEKSSETGIYDAKFLDNKTIIAARGQNWSVDAGLTDGSSISVYDLRSPRPSIQFNADSYQEFRTLSCKEIHGSHFIAGAGDQIASIYDLRMPNLEYLDLSVSEGFYTGGPFKVKAIKWNPSGNMIATAGENHVRLFDFKNNGCQVAEFENKNDSSGFFTEIEWIDDSRIILGNGNGIADVIEIDLSKDTNSVLSYTKKRLQSYKTYRFMHDCEWNNQFQIRFNKKHNQGWSHFWVAQDAYYCSGNYGQFYGNTLE